MVVGRSSESSRRISFVGSLEAACEDELFAFFGWEIAGSFDRDIGPNWAKIGALKWEAVAQIYFGNHKGFTCAFCVKSIFGCGVSKGAKHGFLI